MLRQIAPFWGGKTLLTVRSTLRDGANIVASAETTQAVSTGNFSWAGWRMVFSRAADDLVGKMVGKSWKEES